jgi:hypothetical protein
MPQNEQSSMRQCVRWKRNGENGWKIYRRNIANVDGSTALADMAGSGKPAGIDVAAE